MTLRLAAMIAVAASDGKDLGVGLAKQQLDR